MNSNLYHDQYYENGYFISNVPDEISIRLWNEIYTTEWIDDNVENIYTSIPSWYVSKACYAKAPDGSDRSTYERLIGEELFNKTPSSLKHIGDQIASATSQLEFFSRYYKRHELKYVDMWNGSENIPYHHDTINGCDTLVLIYLTEQYVWDRDWGGSIWMKNSTTNKEVEVLPNNGTMLVINNANPLIYHKVIAMNTSKINRYTFSFIYNWY